MRSSTQRLAALTLVALLAAGCSKTATEPSASITQSDADEIAQQLAVQMAADNGGAMNTLNGSGTPMRAAPSREGLAARPVSTQWDTSFTHGSVDFALSLTFYDVDGNVQAAWDPLTSVRFVETCTATGTLTWPQYQASLFHQGTTEVAGIHPTLDTLVFNGTALDTALASFQSAYGNRTRWFHMTRNTAVNQVRALKDTSVARYPLSGTIAWTVHALRLRSNNRADVEATLDATVTLTFNGTRFPDVVVAGAWRYLFDLRTGAIVRASV